MSKYQYDESMRTLGKQKASLDRTIAKLQSELPLPPAKAAGLGAAFIRRSKVSSDYSDQLAGIHRITARTSNYGICLCGLILPEWVISKLSEEEFRNHPGHLLLPFEEETE